MSLLTVDDIAKCWIGIKDPVGMVSKFDDGEHVKEFAARIEQAVIARLATVSVEPETYLWEHKNGDCSPTLSSNTGPHPSYVVTPLYPAEALAAARVQAINDALNCYSPDDTATDWSDKIRALAGGSK